MQILHLETSNLFRDLVRKGTESDLEKYFECDSIDEAIRILTNEKIDLILSAQEMIDGRAEDFLLKINQSSFKDIPIIMISSSNDNKLHSHYFEMGFIDFIPKDSFSIEKLKDQVSIVKEQSNLTRKLRKASIAVIDDNRSILKIVKGIFSLQEIFNVDLYINPIDLLNSEKNYDIYMIDMLMPNLSGLQLTHALRKKNPMAVIIIISSIDKNTTILQALEAGADDYIMKPFNVDLLTARIRSSFRSFLLMKELERNRREMEYLAVTDELTSAKNRRAILQIFEEEIHKSKVNNTPLAVLSLDLDKFKSVNDQYGHPQGDLVLKKLSSMFINKCRENDSFGRYGGEEFMYIMPETSLDDAYLICDELRKDFTKISFIEIDPDLTLSFSSGLAQWQNEEPENFLKRIDKLLYDAKSQGRNIIQY